MRTLIVALAVLAGLVATMPASAQQAFPAKPVRIVVPFTPGGGVDIYARVIAARLSESLGQSVVVENRAGAGGTLGTNVVAKAPADGHTLLFTTGGTLAVAVSLFKDLPYDPARDFAPVARVAETPLVLVVGPAVQANSVRELLALAKAQPGRLAYAGVPGGGLQLAGELFKSMGGVDIRYVPYKGGSAALADVQGGHVDLMFDNISQSMPLIKAGRLRALGVTTAKRVPALPDLPTIAQAGLPGYEITTWYGLVAPAGTPEAVVARLNREVLRIMALPEVQQRLAADGVEAATTSPEQFGEFIRAEIRKWAKLVQDAGIRAE